jgi:hypothetical protein
MLACIIGFVGFQAPPADAQAEMIVNGGFSNGMQGWGTWDAIVHRIQSGVFEFYRGTGGVSAVVLQNTGVSLPAGAKLKATFQLGNSDTGYSKRVTVIVHSGDWSDLQACTFMLSWGSSTATYEMELFTNRAWTNTTISFYSSMDANRGWIRLDNVSLRQDSTLPTNRVRCIDPYRPSTGLGADTANIIRNGDFGGGMTGWGTSGEIVHRIQSGVFEFYTVTSGPAAVVLQDFYNHTNGGRIEVNQQAEARFHLGNSSSNRKRVSVLIHNFDFTKLSFCTFWLPPSTPLGQYVIRFGNNNYGSSSHRYISFYVSPDDNLGWARLDDVTLRVRPGLTIVGTECHYPGSLPAEVEDFQPAETFMLPTLQPTASGMPALTVPLPELAVPQAESAEESGFAEGSFSE